MRIGEVSKKYNVSEDTLRYYEKAGIIPPVARGADGRRNYSETDWVWVELCKCMRGVGVPVETIAAYVKSVSNGGDTMRERIVLYEEQRRLLLKQREEIDSRLQRLDRKLKFCYSKVETEQENNHENL